MSTADLGSKHLCPNCATKYYDLKKTVVLCPRCGAKPLVASVPKAAAARRASRSAALRR